MNSLSDYQSGDYVIVANTPQSKPRPAIVRGEGYDAGQYRVEYTDTGKPAIVHEVFLYRPGEALTPRPEPYPRDAWSKRSPKGQAQNLGKRVRTGKATNRTIQLTPAARQALKEALDRKRQRAEAGE